MKALDGRLYVRAQELIIFIAPGQVPPEGMVAFRKIATWEELDREPPVGAIYNFFRSVEEGRTKPVCIAATRPGDKKRAIYEAALGLRDNPRTTL